MTVVIALLIIAERDVAVMITTAQTFSSTLSFILNSGSKPSSSRANLDLHSRSQRHHFQVTRLEGPDELSPPTLQGKRHVIVSLVQDYRHGAITANSLLVPIGFCLYRVRSRVDN